jgi:hypothetical protein
MRYELNFYTLFRRNCVFVCMYVRIGMYSLRSCYTQLFGARQKYAHKKKVLQKQICKLFFQLKQQYR